MLTVAAHLSHLSQFSRSFHLILSHSRYPSSPLSRTPATAAIDSHAHGSSLCVFVNPTLVTVSDSTSQRALSGNLSSSLLFLPHRRRRSSVALKLACNIQNWARSAPPGKKRKMGRRSSQVLLDLENKNPSSSSSSSSKESALLVCKNDEFLHLKSSNTDPPHKKPVISSVPKSQVLGKLKDFLGVISESNKKLQLDAVDKSKDYNIEALSGNESEYIEMDLMLGVTDLHTPEAVAAAESAMAGNQRVISLAASSSGEQSEDSSDDDDDDDIENEKDTCSPTKDSRKPLQDESSDEVLKKGRPKKRPKIVELS